MKILAALIVILLLSTGASYARGSHSGGHHASSGHHGTGYHYSHGYTTKKGTHVSGGYRHYPRKKKR